jgi:hypothetical protein
MPHLEPTYLRYIYDGLIKGSIHPENAAELPDGLIGLYEEVFDEKLPVHLRQQLLERFAIWALLKKEVPAQFIAEVLNQPEEEIQEFISTYSAWFNSPESGKYQLYHERLKVYLLQKLSVSAIKRLNLAVIKFLQQQLLAAENTANMYALEFLAHHYMIHYLVSNELEPLLNLVYDKSFWAQQIAKSKGHFWTLNTIRIGINASLFAKKTPAIIRNTVHYLTVELDLTNDVDSLRFNLENNDIALAKLKIDYLEKVDLCKLQLSLLHLLTHAFTQSDSIEKSNIINGIATVLNQLNNPEALLMLPDNLRFELASFCFKNKLDFAFLFPDQKINFNHVSTTHENAVLIDIGQHLDFIEFLLSHQEFTLSNQFKNAILYSSIKSKDPDLIEKTVNIGIKEYNSNTAEYLAEFYFHQNQPILFYEVVSKNDVILEQLLPLAIRMLVKGNIEKILIFIQKLPDIFYQLVMYSQLAEGSLYLNQKENFVTFLTKLKDEDRFAAQDAGEIIKMLEFKRQVSLDEYSIHYVDKENLTEINHVLNGMSIAKVSDDKILTYFNQSGALLFRLNNRNINLISRILGSHVAIEQYLSERRYEIKRNSNQLYNGAFNWEDESLFFFLKGMSDNDFMNHFSSILAFFTSRENLGVHYRLKSKLIRKRFLFFLYFKFKKGKERTKTFAIRHTIYNEFTATPFLEQPPELISLYVDFCTNEKSLFDRVATKTFEELNSSKMSWNKDWHLAKISMEFFESGSAMKGYHLFLSVRPSRWDMHFLTAGKEWKKMCANYLSYFIENQDVQNALVIATRSAHQTEILHQISMQVNISDIELKEKISQKMSRLVDDLNIETSDRITREVKHRNYYSAMILDAELKCNMGLMKEGYAVYRKICKQLPEVKNSDDLQLILQKLCLSLVKYKAKEFYTVITKNLDVINRVVIPFKIKGWYCALGLLRNELMDAQDSELLQKIDQKMNLLDPELIICKIPYANVKKSKIEPFYLLPFHSYQNALYNASTDTMLTTLVRYVAYQCFVKGNIDSPSIHDISQILDFQDWIQIKGQSQSN